MFVLYTELNEKQMKHLEMLWENDYIDDLVMFLIRKNYHVYSLKIKKFKILAA